MLNYALCRQFSSIHLRLITLIWSSLKFFIPVSLASTAFQSCLVVLLTYFHYWYDACLL